MKNIDNQTMASLQGGAWTCGAVLSGVKAFGVAAFAVPTPLNMALGGTLIVTAYALDFGGACPN